MYKDYGKLVLRLSDNVYIPKDTNNADYIEVLRWISDGNVMSTEAPSTPVYTCSPWQIRKALRRQGLLKAVNDAITASTDEDLKDGWQYATGFYSNHPMVLAMGAALGKTEQQMRELIQLASTL